jgi:hypothetical protein
MQLPQTLDEWYLAAHQPSLEQDTDQVMYRYTSDRDKGKGKVLMVHQLWLWQVDSKRILGGFVQS